MRLLIQYAATGLFLCPALDGGGNTWVRSLKEAGGGVISDMETAHAFFDDLEYDDYPQVIDLDRLGTANDYTN
jgi:hypothetical protein